MAVTSPLVLLVAVTGAAITSLAGSVLLTCSGLESGCEEKAPPKIRFQKGSVLLGSVTGGVEAAVVVTSAGGGLAGSVLGSGTLLWVSVASLFRLLASISSDKGRIRAELDSLAPWVVAFDFASLPDFLVFELFCFFGASFEVLAFLDFCS